MNIELNEKDKVEGLFYYELNLKGIFRTSID